MNTSHMFKLSLFAFMISVLIGTTDVSAQTATIPRIYAEASVSSVEVGSTVTVTLFVDSQKPINALETKLMYPNTLLQMATFNESSSVVQLWQDKDWKTVPGTLILSGGIPRAFAGNKGEIGRVTFKALKPGVAQISFSSADMYYADGLGTRVAAQKGTVQILVRAQTPSSSQLPNQPEKIAIAEDMEKDILAPIFGLTDTLRNPSKGNYLAIFEVKDIGSGIAMVEMRTNSLVSWGEWREVTNPAEVAAGTLRYQLRATDNSGNTTIETFYIRSKLIMILGIVILSFAFLVGALYFIIKR